MTKTEARARLRQLDRDCATENWDSYDAAPVTARATADAAEVVDGIDERELGDLVIVPSINGGVELEWPGLLSIEIGPEGLARGDRYETGRILGDLLRRLRR